MWPLDLLPQIQGQIQTDYQALQARLDSLLRLTRTTATVVARLSDTVIRMETDMVSQADLDALGTRIDAQNAVIQTGVSNIRQDIADIKAANPTLDLTALEASVASMETAGASVTELDSENPAPPVA